MIKRNIILIVITLALIPVWFISWHASANAQSEQTVQCGDIIENEFTDNVQEHNYSLSMKPRESFNVAVEPFGNFLNTVIAVYGPSGIRIAVTDAGNDSYGASLEVLKFPSIGSDLLSARGNYRIRVANTALHVDELYNQPAFFGGIGLYTLSIGCTNSDGTQIKPGDIPQPTPTPAPLPTPTPRSAIPELDVEFTGTGFPGLAPVDFADAVTVPLLFDEQITGVIPLDNQILGFTLDAGAGDTLDISYTRASGNMNLGLVVLSENNEVFFQASLVTSEGLTTRFTLPDAGQYTIGVFRISLVEPEEVEPTIFRLTGSLVAETE